MIKYINILLFTTLASFANPIETITLSGTILNSEVCTIMLKGEGFEKEINIKDDGTFSEKIAIPYVGLYNLLIGKNKAPIYLSNRMQLKITADDKNFNSTLHFSGQGSVENQYMIDKSKIISSISNNELYKFDENSFLLKIKEIKLSVMALYGKTEFNDSYFKKREVNNIHYLEQLYLLSYESNHAYYAKKEGYKNFTDFPAFDDKIDLDNDSDFLFSNTYKQIVITKFNKKIDSQMGKQEEHIENFALPEIKSLKSQHLKNALIQDLSYEVKPSNPDFENLFNELTILSNDAKFKENLTLKYNKIKNLKPGLPSPKFIYENHRGGTTALDSLKGKYLYVKVWASWCGTCRKEIPSLLSIEEQYQGKNIEFVSISIDEAKDREKWSKLIVEKELVGTQLFADNDWNSQFAQDYVIDSIPRFILIDPDGNIVNADAPRPSDAKLIELFNNLKM